MKKQISKGLKIIGIVIVPITILIAGIYLSYIELYIPHQYNSLYKEGLNNLEKADSIADELALLGHYDTAMSLLTKAAEKGIAKAQTKLALYIDGYDRDLERSSYWYLQAALNGEPEAQYKIGINYIYGFGVRQDFEKALYWINKSADNKNRWAQYNLGNLYLNGLAYYDLDYDHTDFWYIGNNTFRGLGGIDYTAPNNRLDEILNNPKIVFLSPSLDKAKYYWTLSAKQGCREAQKALEKIYD